MYIVYKIPGYRSLVYKKIYSLLYYYADITEILFLLYFNLLYFVLQMTFLEFFEALIGCAVVFSTEAVVKDPTTPRPSTVITPEQSMYSIPVSPSRMTSQVGMDGGESQAPGTPHQGTGSPESASPTRAVSSVDGVTKTLDPPKPGDVSSTLEEYYTCIA